MELFKNHFFMIRTTIDWSITINSGPPSVVVIIHAALNLTKVAVNNIQRDAPRAFVHFASKDLVRGTHPVSGTTSPPYSSRKRSV